MVGIKLFLEGHEVPTKEQSHTTIPSLDYQGKTLIKDEVKAIAFNQIFSTFNNQSHPPPSAHQYG